MELWFGRVRPHILAVAVAFLLLAGLAVGLAQDIPISIPFFGTTLSFGMIGFSAGETTRLNVVNTVRTPLPVAIAQVPCRLELDFYDAQRKLLKQKVIDNLDFGTADFLDIRWVELSSGGRSEIAAVVNVSSNQSIFCNIAPTLEVFDDITGRTSVILGNPLLSPPSFPLPLANQQ